MRVTRPIGTAILVSLDGRENARKRYITHVAALIMALRLVYEKTAGFGARLVGTLLSRPMARHPIAGLVA